MFGQSLLSAFGSAACTTDTDQLFATDVQTTSLATYQFNNATTSIPSNTYPGTASNITYAAGKFGNAAVFNGSSSFVQIDSIPTNNIFSLSFWVNANDPNSDNDLFHFYDSTNHIAANNIGIANAGTQFGWFPHTSTGGGGFTGISAADTNALFDGSWHHVVIASDANSFANTKIYIDGNEKTLTISNSYTTSVRMEGTLYIGKRQDGYGDFNGKLDQVRIFNTALPQSAVTALYNETTTTATYPYVDYQLANPNSIAYYKMSDATDQLGNYNGTATNVNFNTVGKFGFAGAFNGSSSYIDTSGLLSLFGSKNTNTVSLWFKTTTTNYSTLFSDYASTSLNNSIDLNGSGNIEVFTRYSNTTSTISTTSGNYNDGNWHNVVHVVDTSGLTSTLYIDGSQIGSSVSISSNSWNGAATQKVTIGALYYTVGSFYQAFFNGSIDQVRIYDSALSAANVTTLYNEIECPAVAVTNAFNTVLYTGNGGTQSITSLNFAPDLVWLKSRNYANNHFLYDSVRGTTKAIYIQAEPEITRSGVTSFDNNGFTLGSSTDMNESSKTYVAWNWKAPFANLSTSFNGSSSSITLPTALSDGTTTVANCISFWFNVGAEVTSSTTNNEIMTFAYSGGSSGKISLGSTSGSISNETFSVTSDVTTQYTYSRTNIPAGWNHAVVQWNSAAIKWDIYINGIAHTTYTFGTNEQGNFALKFGQRSSFYFNGSLNQIRVFNSILSASEISDLYAEPLESNNTLNYPAGAGCIAAYPLQTDAVDLSGNYNGAPSNVTFGKPGYLTQNTEGTIPSTVAANVDAGFSIVKYVGSSTSGLDIGHGLSQAPEMVILKNLNSATNWYVYHKDNGTTSGYINYLKLNDSSTGSYSDKIFYPVNFNSSTLTPGYDSVLQGNMIAYCFHSVPGYSKVGIYSGGSSGSSNVIVIGFKPRFLIVKRTDQAGDAWQMFDSTMAGSDTFDDYLQANTSAAEASYNQREVNFTNNGFYWTYAESGTNINGGNYIFLAIA